MLGKLAYRNMKRSAKDYLIYILTMTVVSALMYAFNSLIFQNEFTGMMEEDAIMPIMIGLATFFIVLIMAWLIHYMVRFMMEKRGSEFGIYMLLGMKKKDHCKTVCKGKSSSWKCGAYHWVWLWNPSFTDSYVHYGIYDLYGIRAACDF